MKTITYYEDQPPRLGVVTEQGVIKVDQLIALHSNTNQNYPSTIHELIEGGDAAKNSLEELVALGLNSSNSDLFLNEEELTYGPVVTSPRKILCVGLNYKNHADESNMELPEKPLIFNKFDNALCAHEETIPLPQNAEQFDYEAELALVIGKEAKNVEEKDAMDYVYGFTAANDFSARDLQFQSPQWLLGKNGDKFCPLGPVLVTADEIADYDNLNIKTYVNGEVRQDDNTKNMIFPCEEIVSYISKHMTLYPGDVILTGTPEGVILGYEEDKRNWLKSGDEVVIEIEKIGSLKNRLVD